MSDTLAWRLGHLQETLVRENAQAPGLFGEIARMEGLLAETYRDRVPYELLQNSDDAGSHTVEITHRADGSFVWRNDGRELNAVDIEALCRSASSTKQRGDSIGYRGIGFKSLAAVATRIDVRSGNIAFAFDRDRAAALLGGVPVGSVPLIRIPTDIRDEEPQPGVAFTVTRSATGTAFGTIDPIAALFLRHVGRIVTTSESGSDTLRIVRDAEPGAPPGDGGSVALHGDSGEARFAVLRHGTATVAVPLDSRAVALAGVRGRLACFLPLQDEIGLPVVVSGDLLTDPSRTHAVVADASTRQVLRDAATAIAEQLSTPGAPTFDRLWELLLDGEDIRSALLAATDTAAKVLLSALREAMASRRLPFSYSTLVLEPEDVPVLFPQGAPAALYTARNRASARAIKATLGLTTFDFNALLAGPDVPKVSAPLQTRLTEHLTELAKMHGRRLSEAERRFVESAAGPATEEPTKEAPAAVVERTPPRAPSRGEPLSEVLTRWRAAEEAARQYLNARGWDLRDVSTQNVGYDLEGTQPDGTPVRLEVKKVDRPDARFAMTNNEMSLMLGTPGGYYLAIVVGDGRYAKLVLLDPSREGLTRERVCRRWDWEFTDWARFALPVE
ncbi:DUF3883 domain-containing protein [Micromonospora echinaurantiaca]|uniref:DUF3883 domain-containing protein n=1 Tax=Micromonospora echinaurantiaca TaxID=47857 RepID=UPI0037B805BD